jgi:hypothetical protein
MTERRPLTLLLVAATVLLVGGVMGCLSGCGGTATTTTVPVLPGIVSGTVKYESLDDPSNTEPLADVLVVLCQIAEQGLPEGGLFGYGQEEAQQIGVLHSEPSARTDTQGAFTLDDVPVGTYLVLFDPWPSEIEGVEWDGIALTQTAWSAGDGTVSESGRPDLWETGGRVGGHMLWEQSSGITVSQGNAVSNRFGFCLSIRDNNVTPVIQVTSGQTSDVELTAYFLPE